MAEIIDFQTRAALASAPLEAVDLSDSLQFADALREARKLSLSVFSRLSGLPTESDIAAAINISASVCTLLQCLQVARVAARASEAAAELERECREALDAAERL